MEQIGLGDLEELTNMVSPVLLIGKQSLAPV